MQKPKIIALVGPTSSGKTSLGIFLAQKVGGEIISADSRQVYTGLDIGTGKVTKKEMAGIPHYLLSVASPKRVFTASDFKKQGERAIKKILTNGSVPLVVGGTGLYADVLLGRMVLPDVPPNLALRATLEQKSPAQLLALLKKKDPVRAATIEPQHKRRLIRALEIAAALGKSPARTASLELPSADDSKKYDVLWLGLGPTEEVLHKNIHTRLVARLKSGMLTEAKRLHAHGLSWARMEALGLEYRSMAQYLRQQSRRKVGTPTVFDASGLERAIQKYAKRQMRWFKRNPEITWLEHSPNSQAGKTEALKLVKTFLSGR